MSVQPVAPALQSNGSDGTTATISQPQGESLTERLRRGPIDTRSALAILEQVLVHLEPVHSSGAIHGRITPEVIYLAPEGEVSLTGARTGKKRQKRAIRIEDKISDHPGYMAPEQISGGFLDTRADVFAVGVIAHEMLVGRNPFWAEAGGQSGPVVYRMADRPYPEIGKNEVPGLADDIRLVLDAAMAKDAEARFADATSFLAGLRRAAQSEEEAKCLAEADALDASYQGDTWGDILAEWRFSVGRNAAPYVVAAILVIAGLAVVIFVLLSH